MSKPNGRQKKAIKNLAEALRQPPVEQLAAALQECFDANIEVAERRMQQTVQQTVQQEMGEVKDTLRMIWKQCGGKPDQRLPIDD